MPHLQFAGNNIKIRQSSAPIEKAQYQNVIMGEDMMPIDPLPTNYYYSYTEEGSTRDENAVAKSKKKSKRQISK